MALMWTDEVLSPNKAEGFQAEEWQLFIDPAQNEGGENAWVVVGRGREGTPDEGRLMIGASSYGRPAVAPGRLARMREVVDEAIANDLGLPAWMARRHA